MNCFPKADTSCVSMTAAGWYVEGTTVEEKDILSCHVDGKRNLTNGKHNCGNF